MFKKNLAILSLAFFVVPILASAQNTSAIPTLPTNIDLKNLPNSLPAPLSGFVDQLKSIFENGLKSSIGTQSIAPSGNVNLNVSGIPGTWASLNDWFSSKIGISLGDIIKIAANFIIWIWEFIIKLIQQGLSYL